MKKFKFTFISLLTLAVIVAILLNNKSKIAAKSQSDIATTIPVTTAKVLKSELNQELSLTGKVTANSDVNIVSETEARVVSIPAEVGDHVSKGTLLIQMDDELKKAAYLAADVNYEKAKRDFDRYEALHNDSTVSEAQLENAKLAKQAAEAQFVTARRQYNDTRITSPIAGVVTSKMVDIGSRVKIGDMVANVVDISKLKVKVSVAEKDVFKLHEGDKAIVSSDVYPGKNFDGFISSISDKADDSHSYAVEVIMENSKEYPFKAGMFARVNFNFKNPEAALSIPREAIAGSLREPQVFVLENNVAKIRNLVIGEEIGGKLQVLQGLKEGETVVVNGQNNLKENSLVSIVK